MEFSDGQLVEEAMGGSAVAFERLVARYERLVFKIALGCTGQRDSAMGVLMNSRFNPSYTGAVGHFQNTSPKEKLFY